MMNALAALWRTLMELWQRATAGSVWRQRFFAGGAALGLLLILSGVVLASMAPASTPRQRVVAQATATATQTATATATATAAPHPTATPKPKPVPKTPPPPPAPPPPPPAPPTPVASGGYAGGPVTDDSIFSDFCGAPTPTATSSAPTPTDTPAAATATATTTSATTPTGTGTSTTGSVPSVGFVGLTMIPSSCVSCPFTSGYNSTQTQIAQALASAASTYGLPVNLLKAVAYQESKWHEDSYSCDGGIGLMQIQYYVYPWLNGVSVDDCKIYPTNDNPYTLQGNANLGAKLLKYLGCYYSYWGGYNYDANGNPHSLSNPSKYTVDWYYLQAGLSYPDSSSPNSLCASVFNANGYYPALPSSTNDPWSCPYSATAGDTTLLDITISAYNEGAGNIAKYGINNQWYINGVEGYVPQFANGSLP